MAGVADFREVIKNNRLRNIEKKNWGWRELSFGFFYCFSKYCGVCCGKILAICLMDISKMETVLKIKCQVVLHRKLIKRRK